jgi:hypothetical protein
MCIQPEIGRKEGRGEYRVNKKERTRGRRR